MFGCAKHELAFITKQFLDKNLRQNFIINVTLKIQSLAFLQESVSPASFHTRMLN